jgi:hypothetical protein
MYSLKFLELTRPLNPDVPGSQSILQFRQGAQLVVATIRSGFGEDELGPAFADELDRGVIGQLARVTGVHLTCEGDNPTVGLITLCGER